VRPGPPRVLAVAGLRGHSGLALGLGLDRLLMLAKGLPDVRLLRSADPRVAGQLQDLSVYRAVSAMPPITRDLSVAVGAGDDEETLGDRVRDALGAEAGCVEEVRVLSATACRDLPAAALARLGAAPEQKNLLVRVVLRDLERTLTNADANALRDRIYRALHQGAVLPGSLSGAAADDQHGRVHLRRRQERAPGEQQANRQAEAPGARSRVPAHHRALQHQVGRDQPAAGRQQRPQQTGRNPVRRVRHHPERPAGQRDRGGVRLHHGDPGKPFAQDAGP